MRPKKIGIALPVYNGASFLPACLDSLTEQKFKDFTIYAVDDNSQDSSLELLNNYAGEDSRIRVQSNDRNLGAYFNFMSIVKQVDEPFFLWASQDDIWPPDFLSGLLAILSEDRDIVLAASSIRFFQNKLSDYKRLVIENSYLPSNNNQYTLAKKFVVRRNKSVLQKNNNFIHGLFRTQTFKDVTFNYVGPFYRERHVLALTSLSGRISYSPEIFFYKRLHQDESRRIHDYGFKKRNSRLAILRDGLKLSLSAALIPNISVYARIYGFFLGIQYVYDSLILRVTKMAYNLVRLNFLKRL